MTSRFGLDIPFEVGHRRRLNVQEHEIDAEVASAQGDHIMRRPSVPLPPCSRRARLLARSTLMALPVLAVFTLGACSSRHSEPASPGAHPALLDHVRFRMSWEPSSEYAGIIAAVRNGFYAKHGIDCEIEPGGVGLNSLTLVASGADQFGLAGADSLLIARSRGVPVKAFATEFQVSPQVFFARKSSGIQSPAQFPGHVIGIKPGKTAETMFAALMGKVGVDPATVKTEPVKEDLREFFAGKVDVWPGFVFDEAETARAHGIDINIIQPSQYGVQFYADVIFATDSTLRDKPDLIRRFLAATRAGWEWAGSHPDEVLKSVLTAYPELSPSHERTVLRGTLPLVVGTRSNPVRPMGKMNASTWSASYKILDSQHLLQTSFPVTDAYTLQFSD